MQVCPFYPVVLSMIQFLYLYTNHFVPCCIPYQNDMCHTKVRYGHVGVRAIYYGRVRAVLVLNV